MWNKNYRVWKINVIYVYMKIETIFCILKVILSCFKRQSIECKPPDSAQLHPNTMRKIASEFTKHCGKTILDCYWEVVCT